MPPRSLYTTSVELVSRKENHSKGRTHPRLSQHNSRQGIESQTRHIRLASEPELLSDINGQARPVYDRPFWKQNQSPTSQVFQLQTRPGSRGDRCPDTTMGNRNRLRLSSIHFNSQIPKEGNSREGNNNSSLPSLSHSALVCTTPPTGGGHPILLPIIPGLLTGPQGQEHPLVSKNSSYFPAGGYQARSSYKRLIRTSYRHCPRCPENFNSESVQVMLVKMGGLV